MTANAFKEDREKCFQAGANDFVTKPIQKTHLLNILSNYLTATQATTDPSPSSIKSSLEAEQGFEDLLVKYACSLQHGLDEIRSAVTKQRWDVVRARIHEIKGTGGAFGYPSLTQIAAQIEFQLTCENLDDVNVLLPQFEQICTAIIAGTRQLPVGEKV